MPLDANSHKPLYLQLAAVIRHQIESGEIAVGEKILSEHALARQYGVGRPTVRQATELLVRTGRLKRKRGSGTFVAETDDAVDLLSLGGTMASFEKSGTALSSKVIKAMKLRPRNDVFGGNAYTMDRTSAVNRKIILLEQFAFDPQIFPDLDRLDCSGSLSDLVRQHYNREAIRAIQHFTVVTADEKLAKVMRSTPGMAFLKVNRVLDFREATGAVHVTLHCDTSEMAFSQAIQEPV